MSERRIYDLSDELLTRLRAYQKRQGIRNETEAARRVLETGLDASEGDEALAQRAVRAARERGIREGAGPIVVGHPSVTTVSFQPRNIIFETRQGQRFDVSAQGFTVEEISA